MLSEFKSDIEKTVTSTFEKMRGVGDKEISTEAVADIGTVQDDSKIFESFLWINPRLQQKRCRATEIPSYQAISRV